MMRDIAAILEDLRQPGIPRSAAVHLRYSNGVAQQERITNLTLGDLQQLAVILCGDELVQPPTRNDDRRESDRHPPRPL